MIHKNHSYAKGKSIKKPGKGDEYSTKHTQTTTEQNMDGSNRKTPSWKGEKDKSM